MVFYDGVHLLKEENYVDGFIADRLIGKIKPGFPYRPIFIISKLNKTFGATSAEEDEEVGHRRKSLRALKPKILKLLS